MSMRPSSAKNFEVNIEKMQFQVEMALEGDSPCWLVENNQKKKQRLLNMRQCLVEFCLGAGSSKAKNQLGQEN